MFVTAQLFWLDAVNSNRRRRSLKLRHQHRWSERCAFATAHASIADSRVWRYIVLGRVNENGGIKDWAELIRSFSLNLYGSKMETSKHNTPCCIRFDFFLLVVFCYLSCCGSPLITCSLFSTLLFPPPKDITDARASITLCFFSCCFFLSTLSFEFCLPASRFCGRHPFFLNIPCCFNMLSLMELTFFAYL